MYPILVKIGNFIGWVSQLQRWPSIVSKTCIPLIPTTWLLWQICVGLLLYYITFSVLVIKLSTVFNLSFQCAVLLRIAYNTKVNFLGTIVGYQSIFIS